MGEIKIFEIFKIFRTTQDNATQYSPTRKHENMKRKRKRKIGRYIALHAYI